MAAGDAGSFQPSHNRPNCPSDLVSMRIGGVEWAAWQEGCSLRGGAVHAEWTRLAYPVQPAPDPSSFFAWQEYCSLRGPDFVTDGHCWAGLCSSEPANLCHAAKSAPGHRVRPCTLAGRPYSLILGPATH